MNKLILFCGLLTLAVRADTIKFMQGDSFNGKVTFEDGRFKVIGLVRGKDYPIDRISPDDVDEVRFNKFDSNPNPPGPLMPVRGAHEVLCEVEPALGTGTLVKIGEKVEIEGKDPIPRNRISVLRILHK